MKRFSSKSGNIFSTNLFLCLHGQWCISKRSNSLLQRIAWLYKMNLTNDFLSASIFHFANYSQTFRWIEIEIDMMNQWKNGIEETRIELDCYSYNYGTQHNQNDDSYLVINVWLSVALLCSQHSLLLFRDNLFSALVSKSAILLRNHELSATWKRLSSHLFRSSWNWMNFRI